MSAKRNLSNIRAKEAARLREAECCSRSRSRTRPGRRPPSEVIYLRCPACRQAILPTDSAVSDVLPAQPNLLLHAACARQVRAGEVVVT